LDIRISLLGLIAILTCPQHEVFWLFSNDILRWESSLTQVCQEESKGYSPRVCIAHLRQECHDSKFGIFELLVQKEMFADALLTSIVSWRSLQNSPLESSFVVVALLESYGTSKPLKVSPEKSHTFWVVTLLSQMSDIFFCFTLF